MKRYKISVLAFSALTLLGFSSCFNLDESVYSEVTESTFTPTDQDVASLMASAYSPLTYIMDWQGLFDAQEESGDVIITPTRPNGWDDGGTYRRMHQHEWNSEQWQCENAYDTPYGAINNANRILSQIESNELQTGDLKESTIAELRAIRAVWYMMLLDTHGNVPIVTKFDDEVPVQATRQQVFEFVVNELKEVIPLLSEEVNAATYGRLTKWGALTALARVYLNGKVYTGKEYWKECLECCEQIIKSKKFSLATSYKAIFAYDNGSSCPEIIFAVPYDSKFKGFHMQHKWFPSTAKLVFGNSSDYFWGGSCANPQFINAYQEGDKRLEDTWLMGEQRSADGKLIWTCKNYLPSLTCIKDGQNYTSVDYGYRVWKYGNDPQTTNGGWSNDFPFFRYAEVLLDKAECLLRLGQNKEEAARIVTELRKRDFDDAAKATVTVTDLEGDTRIKYGTLDWDNNIDDPGDQTPVLLGGLYDEWGFEFACEAQRRTQMIRFGTYSTKNWFNHVAVKDGHTAIFPIPLRALETNGKLNQNPGYDSNR
ncbi:RagB/SusD family nutrient uptake outer membrane protein [Segatella sinensis]|uniref:RagB/SusD family nutrient uptake outer membrane protein n=1 Tax=Segatella sinensis TaxID=3085167 RepID=A0ABV1FXK4_9BACT